MEKLCYVMEPLNETYFRGIRISRVDPLGDWIWIFPWYKHHVKQIIFWSTTWFTVDLLFVNIEIHYLWITFQFVVWKVVSSHYSINVRYFWRNVNTIFFKQFIWKMSTYYCLSSPICFQTFSWIVGCILFDQILFKLHVGNHAILLLSVCPSCSSFKLKYFLLLHQYFLI